MTKQQIVFQDQEPAENVEPEDSADKVEDRDAEGNNAEGSKGEENPEEE